MNTRFLAVAFATAVPFLASSAAYAADDDIKGIAACGNIDVKASAQCKAEVSGGCTAQCTPVHFEAACSATVDVSKCTGSCNVKAEASCTATCQGSCETKCNGDPSISCSGACALDCDASCDSQCSGEAAGSKAQADCKASCQGSCHGRCEASCKVNPPDCKTKCESACNGSCEAKVNAKCDIDCSKAVVAECSAKLEGGCKTQCEQPNGAVFCDGQYVDAGNNLADCEAALNAWLKAHVDVSARGSASCSGSSCQAEGEASASCSVADVRSNGALSGVGGLAVAALAGLFARRRRAV